MNKRILNINISINEIKTVRLEDATQGDKNTHFFDLTFSDDIELEGYELQIYYLQPFPATIPLVDSFSNLQKTMQIVIPPNVLKRNGEVTVEFALSNNDELITINKKLTFEVVKTANGTSIAAYAEGTLKETIAQQIEKIKTLLTNADNKINEYNKNANNRTNEFNDNALQKTNEFNKNLSDALNNIDTTINNATDKVVEEAKTEVKNHIEIKIKPAIETYVNTTSKTEIDTHVETVSKVDIDNYVATKEEQIKGATYTPAIDEAGNLSFENDKGLPNPPTVNIKGPKGEDGVNGNDGAPGAKGEKGDTPVKGVDYYTEQEKQEFAQSINSSITAEGNKQVTAVKNQGNTSLQAVTKVQSDIEALLRDQAVEGNALSLNGKTGPQYDKEIQGVAGGYSGNFPLTSAVLDGIYLVPQTGKFYVCTKAFGGKSLSAPDDNFEELSVYKNYENLMELFSDVKLYNQDSMNIVDNLFNTSITKIVGVKLTVEADKFASSDNALIEFNYTKLLKKCCFANLIFVSPRGAWLGSSLENNVNVRVQYIDSVQLILGILGNNKKEKIDLYLALYGN